MNYLLTGEIAQHFRDTGNEWQTALELRTALNLTYGEFGKRLQKLNHANWLQKKGQGWTMSYRIPPSLLHAPAAKKKGFEKDIAEVAKKFCEKWGVEVPYDVTSRNPEALRDWVELMDNRI